MEKPRRNKGWFLVDTYARVARGEAVDAAEGLGTSRVYVAARDFAHFVMPTLDGFDVRGDNEEHVKLVRELVIEHYGRRDLWGNQISLSMAIYQTWVSALLRHRDIYIHIQYDRDADPIVPIRLDYLPPETIEPRTSDRGRLFEQYVSRRSAHTEGRERWFSFDEDEIIHLTWPLAEPRGRGTPAQIADRKGRRADRLGDMTLYTTQAGATPDEMFLPLVRARHGAYRQVLEQLQDVQDAAGDLLFYPPDRDVTEFFWADRFTRAHIAGATVRDYIIAELNRQWFDRWCPMNDWQPVQLVFLPQLFTAAEWQQLRDDLHAGRASAEDVSAARTMEFDELRRFIR